MHVELIEWKINWSRSVLQIRVEVDVQVYLSIIVSPLLNIIAGIATEEGEVFCEAELI